MILEKGEMFSEVSLEQINSDLSVGDVGEEYRFEIRQIDYNQMRSRASLRLILFPKDSYVNEPTN